MYLAKQVAEFETRSKPTMPTNTLHITSGDCAGSILVQTGITGEILVWHDVLYDGPREPGWPCDAVLQARAEWLSDSTGGGLDKAMVYHTLQKQYEKLRESASRPIMLWFDACLFDLAMLVHIMTCLKQVNAGLVELICIDKFLGIEPYHGLGQLTPKQLASFYDKRLAVTDAQYDFAVVADAAFAKQDLDLLQNIADTPNAPLPWLPAAVKRWLQEFPDSISGLGRLESMALEAICNGCITPPEIFKAVASAEIPPQFWGDTTLWAKINGLADRKPPLVKISGPAERLPQWESKLSLADFQISS